MIETVIPVIVATVIGYLAGVRAARRAIRDAFRQLDEHQRERAHERMRPYPFTEPRIVAAHGNPFAPVGTIAAKEVIGDTALTLPVDGSSFDPDRYPDLAVALEPLGLPRGQLPDLRGRAVRPMNNHARRRR
jgi:hypothetical protein